MNIKEKLIEQLGVLEDIQKKMISKSELHLAADTSRTIMDYIRCIDMTEDDTDNDYICPDCEEAMLKESLHQEIAERCDLPIELVNRVLAGQDEALCIER